MNSTLKMTSLLLRPSTALTWPRCFKSFDAMFEELKTSRKIGTKKWTTSASADAKSKQRAYFVDLKKSRDGNYHFFLISEVSVSNGNRSKLYLGLSDVPTFIKNIQEMVVNEARQQEIKFIDDQWLSMVKGKYTILIDREDRVAKTKRKIILDLQSVEKLQDAIDVLTAEAGIVLEE